MCGSAKQHGPIGEQYRFAFDVFACVQSTFLLLEHWARVDGDLCFCCALDLCECSWGDIGETRAEIEWAKQDVPWMARGDVPQLSAF